MIPPTCEAFAFMCIHMQSEPASSLALEGYMAAGRGEVERSRMLFDAAAKEHRKAFAFGISTSDIEPESARDVIESAAFWAKPETKHFHF